MILNPTTDSPADPTPAPLNGLAFETTLDGEFDIEVNGGSVSTDPAGVHVPPPSP